MKSISQLGAAAVTALFAIIFCAAVSGTARAGVFSVGGVPVDVTAESAAKAREQALAQGQGTALTTILRRLTLQRDWARLPAPDSVRLDSLVSGFAVSDERASTTRYLAKVTYDFIPEEVRRLLRANNVAFTEVRSKPTLVLPVLAAPNGSFLLFEPQNIWAVAWRDPSLAEQLVPLVVPAGDLDDANDLRGFSPLNVQWTAVQAIAEKYGAGSVLVPILSLRKTAVGVYGDVRVIEAKPEGVTETRRAHEGPDETFTMNDAVAGLSASIQETWKAANAVIDTATSSLDADVRFNGLQQWLIVKRGLDQVPTVRSMSVIGFSVDGARVSLSYAGTSDQLITGLAQRDITLRQESPGVWVIEPRSVPPVPTPSVAPLGPGAPAATPPKGSL